MKIFFFILSLAAFQFTQAQTKGTAGLYAYEQTVSPGTQRSWSEGNEDAETPSGKNYLIYLLSTARVYPAQVWIRGEEYSATVKTIRETPVMMKHPNIPAAPAMELVPKTSKTVTQLILRPAVEGKRFPQAEALARENELVVVYKMSGRLFYNSLNKFSPLPAAVRQ